MGPQQFLSWYAIELETHIQALNLLGFFDQAKALRFQCDLWAARMKHINERKGTNPSTGSALYQWWQTMDEVVKADNNLPPEQRKQKRSILIGGQRFTIEKEDPWEPGQ